ncbi:MAG: hypothetical protein ACP5RT_01260 [Candidatus Micrarchaeia archaeon]
MELIKKNKARIREYGLALAAYTIIALILFWQLTIGLWNSTIGYGGDTYQSMWNLWWVNYALFNLHTTPYFTNLIYYPVGANLITQTMSPLLGLFSLPLQLISLPFALNILIILGIILSGLFMYMLAKYLTGDIYGSFLAGLIFALSPEHLVQSIGHLQWSNIEFIPLFILFFLLMIKDRKIKFAVLSSVFFILAVFAGDVEQGILITLFAALMLVYYVAFDKVEKKRIMSKKFAISLGIFIILVLVIGSPGFIPMLQGIKGGVLSYVNSQAGIKNNMLYSDTLASFFLPSYLNPIFNSIPGYQSFYANSVVDVSEGTAYIGYSVLFLISASVYYGLRKKEIGKIGVWLFVGIIFFFLSLGPYMRISGFPSSSFGLVPGLYLVYHTVPLLNVFREPGRFDFAVTIILAVLSAFGFKYLSEKFDKEKIFVLFFVIILLEYWALFPQVTKAYIPKAYYYIGEIPGNYSILILPTIPNYSSQAPMKYMGVELYYQTVFHKPLVGGYATRFNQTQLNAISEIPLAVEANYLSNTGELMLAYPINENYSQLNLYMLANFNVGFISIIRQAYNSSQLLQLASYLYSVFGSPVYQSNTTIMFSTKNAINSNVGKHVISYILGDWFPGYYACSSAFCNQTLQEMWWGNNTRGIALFAPRNATHLKMNFSAMYYQRNASLEVYLNSQSSNITIPLSQNPRNYSITLNLSSGFNVIVLSSKNAFGPSSNFNFGIMNITFSPA